MRKKLRDRDEGIAYDSEGLTVERYMNRCMESIKDRVRPDTFKPYEAIVRLHIKPTLGRTKLDKLAAMQLEKLYREKLDAGLSPRRVRYIHVTAHDERRHHHQNQAHALHYAHLSPSHRFPCGVILRRKHKDCAEYYQGSEGTTL